MAAANEQEMCTCRSCPPLNVDVVCQTFAQSMARFNDGSNHASVMAINNQQNLQSMFNVKAQQLLERGYGERISEALNALAASQPPRVGSPAV